ncbi:MAG TPA: hypothetical protein VGE55_13215 [Limnobacter sp.]|uniref:hypothetical protein n=1 Tax=Limnobacter sp. TaxID=2003368 RepID=UPI002EDA1EBE
MVTTAPVDTAHRPATNPSPTPSEDAETVYQAFVHGSPDEKAAILRDPSKLKLLGDYLRNQAKPDEESTLLQEILDLYMLDHSSKIDDKDLVPDFLKSLGYTRSNSDYGTIESTLVSYVADKRSKEGKAAFEEYFGTSDTSPPSGITQNFFSDLSSSDPKRRARAQAALNYFMSLPAEQQQQFMNNMGKQMGELMASGQAQGSDAQKWMSNALAFVKNLMLDGKLAKGTLLAFVGGVALRYQASNPELFETGPDGKPKFKNTDANVTKVFQLLSQEFTINLGGDDQVDPSKAYFDMDVLETVRRACSLLIGKDIPYMQPDGTWSSVLGNDLKDQGIDPNSKIDVNTLPKSALPAAWQSATNRKAKLAARYSQASADNSLAPEEKQKILANLKAQMDALDSIIEQIQKLGGKALELWIDAWKTAFR